MWWKFFKPDLYGRALKAARYIRSRTSIIPETAVVLGSGLGSFVKSMGVVVEIPYSKIPGFLPTTVEGHEGRLVIGRVNGVWVLVMQGRLHCYEGYPLEDVTFPFRVLKLLGIKQVILTNAAGGVNLDFTEGALMFIEDHINCTGLNPLQGPNDVRFGRRFPDMSKVYNPALLALGLESATECQVPVVKGVYGWMLGPSYETPAEIRKLRHDGVDAVGMSTVPEALVLNHMDIPVLGMSCITNMAAGVLDQPITHEEVIATTERVKEQFVKLLSYLVVRVSLH